MTDKRPIFFANRLNKAIRLLADIQTDKISKEEVLAWFEKHPNPDDDDVHAFAESLGIEPHEFEEIVYSLLTEHLRTGIKLLAQALEDLPPQEGYPELHPDWHETVPEPIGYVYHVSPYAKEIMEQGFILDPTKTTLGAFGELNSVSTTNYENAVVYKEGIQIVVGVGNGELDTQGLVKIIGPSIIEEPATYKIKEEFLNFWNDFYTANREVALALLPEEYKQHEERYKQEMGEFDKFVEEVNKRGEPTDEELTRSTEMYEAIERPMTSFLASNTAKEWFWNFFINDLDFEGNPLSEDEAKQRRWEVLKAAAFYTDIPVVCGIDIPEHLQTRKMSDVGIVEVAVAPVEYTKHPPYKKEDIGKGVYSYTPGEQEWKFYDITDLMPVRIVGHLNSAIKRLAEYYRWEGQSLDEILNRWVEEGDKLYDASTFETAFEEEKYYHGIFDIYEILPYREYIWTKEDARRNPEEWEELKESIRWGWDLTGPILLQVGKNRMAKVGEGNHRLAVALELIEEEGLEVLRNVPVYIGFNQAVFYTMGPGWKHPEERAVSQQKRLEEHEEWKRQRAEEERKLEEDAAERRSKTTPEELEESDSKNKEIMDLLGF